MWIALSRWIGTRLAYHVYYRIGREHARITHNACNIRKPVFLWGAGRTGSYILYDILSLHPEFVCLRDYHRENKGLYGSEHYGGGEFDYLIENPFPPVEGAKRLLLRNLPEVNSSVVPGTNWPSVEALKAIEKSYKLLAASSIKSRRLLDKAPHYTFYIDVLEQIFPDALHVHCIRHPEAVASSYIRVMSKDSRTDKDGFWGTRPPGWEAYTDTSVETRATWIAVQSIRTALSNESMLEDRCVQVRYEDVATQPQSTYDALCGYLEIPDAGIKERLPKTLENFNRPIVDKSAIDSSILDELEELVSRTGYKQLA